MSAVCKMLKMISTLFIKTRINFDGRIQKIIGFARGEVTPCGIKTNKEEMEVTDKEAEKWNQMKGSMVKVIKERNVQVGELDGVVDELNS